MKIVMTEQESGEIRRALAQGLAKTLATAVYPTYWYPLLQIRRDIPALAFRAEFFDDWGRMAALKRIFAARDVKGVCVVPELSPVYESTDMAADGFFDGGEDGYGLPYYSEQYVFERRGEWLIYTSHEHTITFAGQWLTAAIRADIPDYRDGLIGWQWKARAQDCRTRR